MIDGVVDGISRPARLAGRILRANVTRPARPWKLNFCATYWCQYKCQTCNIWQRKPTDELSTAEIVEFVRQNAGVSWVDLTGGEIFLRPDIDQVFDAIVTGWRDLMVLHFPTNGFMTDAIVASAARLARSRVPHLVITVSVDGNEELNDRVRGIKGGFRRQVDTFNRLRAIERVRVVFGVTQSRHNVGRFEETFAALRRECPGLSMDDVHLNMAQMSEHYYGNAADAPVAPPRDQAMRELHAYRDARPRAWSPARWLENKFLANLDRYVESAVTPMPCHSLRSSCFVDPWGTVYPCISYARPIGNLRQTGMRLDPIWNGELARNTQQEIWSGDCPQCWTACEAYQSILGNVVRPFSRVKKPVTVTIARPAETTPTSPILLGPDRMTPSRDATIVIAAKDEAATIEAVVRGCLPHADAVLVMLHQSSRDGTDERATQAGARVIRDHGRGKGHAMRLAIAEIGTRFTVFVDADGSHDLSDIPKLLAPLRDATADHVSGSRLTGGSSELHGGFDEFFRLAGSSFITACINWRFDVRLSDSQNGFRAIRTDVLRCLPLTSDGTTIEQEMIMKSLALGYRVAEVPSHEHKRLAGVSHISVRRAALGYLWSLLRDGVFARTRHAPTLAIEAPAEERPAQSVIR